MPYLIALHLRCVCHLTIFEGYIPSSVDLHISELGLLLITPEFVPFYIRASRVRDRIGFGSGSELGLNPGLWVVRVKVRQPDLISGFVRGVRVRIGQPDLTSGFVRGEFELSYLRFKVRIL